MRNEYDLYTSNLRYLKEFDEYYYDDKVIIKFNIIDLLKDMVYYLSCLVLILIICCNLLLILKSILNPYEPLSIFGRAMIVNMSESVNEIEEGSLVFLEFKDVEELEKGDIVVYLEFNNLYIGKLTQFTEYGWKAKSDIIDREFNGLVTNSTEIGVYTGHKIEKIGYFILWAKSPIGILLLVIIPLIFMSFNQYRLRKKQERILRLLEKREERRKAMYLDNLESEKIDDFELDVIDLDEIIEKEERLDNNTYN